MEAGPIAKPWIPEGHVEMHLKKAKDGKSENWLVRSSSGWGDATNIIMHARPPLDVIGTVGRKAPALRAHGGLSPGAMRRVREYVEAHLGHSVDLAALAAVAGVSIHHFARAFKQSAGITPHRYLIQRRVERAQDMLTHTDLSLSDVAYAVGFSDQSHLAHHFRQAFGITPGRFRWLQN